MQVRGKLFVLDGNNWKERGTGILKLNVRAEDGTNPRLGMRIPPQLRLAISDSFMFPLCSDAKRRGLHPIAQRDPLPWYALHSCARSSLCAVQRHRR
jgi:hypothetical protein